MFNNLEIKKQLIINGNKKVIIYFCKCFIALKQNDLIYFILLYLFLFPLSLIPSTRISLYR